MFKQMNHIENILNSVLDLYILRCRVDVFEHVLKKKLLILIKK